MRTTVIQTFAIGLILINQVLAAPLEVKQVAADATWLVHFDVDAIRASTVVQKAWQKVLEKYPDIEANLGLVRIVTGTDPGRDVHGITVYEKVNGGANAVAIVAALVDPERLTLLSSVIPGRETTMHGDYAIHSWTSKYHDHALTIALAFRGREQLLLASNVDDTKAALDVLDGKSPGIAADSSLGGSIPAGTAFLVRAEELAKAKLPGKATVKLPIDSLQVLVGECDGQSFLRARVTMIKPESVAYVLTAIHGGQALSNLLCSDELGRKFVNALHSKFDGQNVTILWNVPADDVWDGLMRIDQAKKPEIAKPQGQGDDKQQAGKKKKGKAPAQKRKPAKKKVLPDEDF